MEINPYFSKDFELDEVPFYGPVNDRLMSTSNGCLDTAKWLFGKEMNGSLDEWSMQKARIMVNIFTKESMVTHYHKSHDNFTGLVALRGFLGIPFGGVDYDEERTYHPRAQLFYNWVHRQGFLLWFGLIFVGFANIFTCLRREKIRNGVSMVKTSNELLMILMYRGGLKDVLLMWPFGWICHKLLVRRFGKDYMQIINEVRYPRSLDHPVKVEWRQINQNFKWWRP